MNIARTTAFLVAFGCLQLGATPSGAITEEFAAIVAEILSAQTEGRISEMGPQQKIAMIACVNGVLVNMPNGKKRYIMQGVDLDEREDRFGKVLYENRGEWVQNVARACARVALSGGT